MSGKLRVHHILCTSLYEGKGYSSTFCDNMSSVVDELRKHPDEKCMLVAEPDMICANCPNHRENDGCSQNGNHIVEKDLKLLNVLGFREGNEYSYRELCRQARKTITEEIFLESCGNCEWRRQGLCRYEDLTAQLDRMEKS